MNPPSKRQFLLMGIMIIILLLGSGCSFPTGTQEPVAEEPVNLPPATDTPVPTNTSIPTVTPTPTPAGTATPTPEADPRQELGNSTWGAVFEDGTQTWYQYDHSNGKAEVRDNKLVLTSKKANGYDNWSMSYPPMTDFYLEVGFTTGPVCTGKDRYGILFRAPDSTQGYLYNLSCDGAFQVRLWDGVEFTQLIDWTDSEHILPGPEVEHRVGVWAQGDHYQLYVNGFQVGEFTDGTFVVESTFGAAHGATDTVGFTVDVTEAKAWELPVE